MLNQYMVKQCNAIRRELGKEELPLDTTGEVGNQNVKWDCDYVERKFGLAVSCFIDGVPNEYVVWADPRTRQVCVCDKMFEAMADDFEVLVAHNFKIVKDNKVVLGWGI